MIVEIKTQVQICVNKVACAEATQHEQLLDFLLNHILFPKLSLQWLISAVHMQQLVKKQTTPYMFETRYQLKGSFATFRCLLNPCSKLAYTNEW